MMSPERVDLAGRLETIPFPELLQFLDQTRRRGVVTLVAPSGERARCTLVEGGIVQARAGHLRDREAIIAMLAWRQGRFELTEEPSSTSGDAPAAVLPLVLEEARLEDELERHLQGGLDDHAKLVLRDPTEPPDDALDTGVHAVFSALAGRPGSCIADLVAILALAPIKVRLSVAWLGATGHLVSGGVPGAPVSRPQAAPADWYGELLGSYPAGVRVLVASSPALSSRELGAMVDVLAGALRAGPGALTMASDGPSMVRLRPPAGGLVSFTFLPMKPKHRVLFQTFARTADLVLVTETCTTDELAAWESDAPLHIPRGLLPKDGAPGCLLDALVAFTKRRSARRARRM
jgi:hypothetical protein